MENLIRSWDRPAHSTVADRINRIGNTILGLLASAALATVSVSDATAATMALSPMVTKSTLLSAVDSDRQISVILALPLGDSKGAAEFVRRVSDPKDPLFREYISPEHFAARYGADAADYAALKQWAIANGLAIVREAGARTFLRSTMAIPA